MMKRLICTALALSLMGATAASARSWNRGYQGDHRAQYGSNYRDWQGRRHHNGNDGVGVALGIGLALFAVAAMASAGDGDRGRYDYGYDYVPPPPPPPPPPYYGGGYGPYGY